MDCIFCKIANGEFNTEFLYESDNVVAFKDINPSAPVHILVIPKKHIVSISDIDELDKDIISEIFLVLKELAKENKIIESGYRIFTNTGEDGGQVVKHLHFHLIGGEKLGDCW